MKRQGIEFYALLLTGLLHITIELLFIPLNPSRTNLYGTDFLFNMTALILWSIYFGIRIYQYPKIVKEWGFRLDNFNEILKPSIYFAIPVMIVFSVYGIVIKGYSHSIISFILILLIYPLWGISQQFALQVLGNKNLKELGLRRGLRILLVGLLFGLSHFPNYLLMFLVFPLGFFTAYLYDRSPNLWSLGLLHGTLGAFAYFFILGQDPFIEFLSIF